MRKFDAREIALSGMACALATLCMTLGVYYSPLLFTGYLFASLSLTLPLARGQVWGNVLSYVGASFLSLLFASFVGRAFDTVPFIAFFGLHPLVNYLERKKGWNKYVCSAIKAVWFDLSAYLTWWLVFQMNSEIPWIDEHIVPVIALIGTALFFFYDFAQRRAQSTVNYAVERFIGKRGGE